jgi:hypothetical protein
MGVPAEDGGRFVPEITLIVERKPYRVRVHRGTVDVAATAGLNKISLSRAELAQIIAGARHSEEMLATKRRLVNTSGTQLLATIFPKRTPYIWHIDRF